MAAKQRNRIQIWADLIFQSMLSLALVQQTTWLKEKSCAKEQKGEDIKVERQAKPRRGPDVWILSSVPSAANSQPAGTIFCSDTPVHSAHRASFE